MHKSGLFKKFHGNKIELVGGFTIIETMIVIAITGLIGLAAFRLVDGRINQTNFQISVNDFKVKLEQLITTSSIGYHVSNQNNIACNPGNKVPPTIFPSSTTNIGSNQGCILLGQTVLFNLNQSTYQTNLVVGNQMFDNLNSPTITDSYPIVVAQTIQNMKTQNNLIIYCISATLPCESPSNITELAFLTADSNQNINTGSNGAFNINNPRPLTVFAVNNSGLISISGNISYSKYYYICVISGSTNQSGLLTITNQANVVINLKIYNDSVC